MTSLLVVNLHGLINTRGPRCAPRSSSWGSGSASPRRSSATTPSTVGALHLCKDYVAWSQVDAELLRSLLKTRGRVSNSKTLDEEALKPLGYKDHSDLASKMIKERFTSSRRSQGLKPFFGLSPPRGRVQALLAEAVQGGRNPRREPHAARYGPEDDVRMPTRLRKMRRHARLEDARLRPDRTAQALGKAGRARQRRPAQAQVVLAQHQRPGPLRAGPVHSPGATRSRSGPTWATSGDSPRQELRRVPSSLDLAANGRGEAAGLREREARLQREGLLYTERAKTEA